MDRANEDPPIPSTGLTVICSPETPNLDVVFVHGFTGHPVRTWTHKKGDMGQQNREDVEILEPPSRIQKLGLFSKSQVRAYPIMKRVPHFGRKHKKGEMVSYTCYCNCSSIGMMENSDSG